MQGTYKIVDKKDVPIPGILYKYRRWENEYEKKTLTSREVFFAPPMSFEDPLDCRIPISYELLTEENIYDYFYSRAHEEHPEWNRQMRRKYAREWAKKTPIRDKAHREKVNQEFFEEFNKRYGILCLTENNRRFEMWEKYSNDHKGFCVGFNPIVLLETCSGTGNPVMYSTPFIHPLDDKEVQMVKQIYLKDEKWAFEEEFRVHKMHPQEISWDERVAALPREAFHEVILGANIPDVFRAEIEETMSSVLPTVPIRQARLLKDNSIIIESVAKS